MLRVATANRPLPPPGIDPDSYAAALFEDVAEVVYGMAEVDSLVICGPGGSPAAHSLVWPEVPVLELAEHGLLAAAGVAAGRGYAEAVVVAGDVPDLPALILAKAFQALSRSPVAVAPADGGGAVAIGVRLPPPPWLPAVDLDTPAVVAQLRRAAPRPAQVAVTPGWHRLRTPSDVHQLDPGLEGWEATRALLSGLRPRGA